MTFKPYVHQVKPYTATSYAAQASANDVTRQPISASSIVFPVGVVVNLAIIPGSNEQDYFLWMPLENSLQDVLIGADADADAPAGFSVQLVQRDGEEVRELTTEESLSRFTVDPVSLELPGQILDGPVFLRVRSPAAAQVIYVTLHIMASEVL